MLGYQFETTVGFRQLDLLGLYFLAVLTFFFYQLVELIELPLEKRETLFGCLLYTSPSPRDDL